MLTRRGDRDDHAPRYANGEISGGLAVVITGIIDIIWLVVSKIFLEFSISYMGWHPSHLLSYFSIWLKPPSSYGLAWKETYVSDPQFHANPICGYVLFSGHVATSKGIGSWEEFPGPGDLEWCHFLGQNGPGFHLKPLVDVHSPQNGILVGGDWTIFYDFHSIIGVMSSSQLTKSIIFQRGGEKPPTSIVGKI